VEEDVLRITGDGRKETDWLNWSPEQARGEYDYDVEPESSRDNTAVDRAQISQALQVATPLLAQLNPNGIQVMLRKYLETFPALGDIDLILPEPPGEEAMQGNPESDQEILDLINSTDPDEFLDTINKLPQNEKQTILASVERLTSQGQVPGMQQNTPVTPQDGPASN
jgi:hypothetical protein